MLDKFEVAEEFGPYRFIGKSVYCRAWQDNTIAIQRGTWKYCDWVFETLDNMKEYASDVVYNCSLWTFEKFDNEKQLMGYTIGRFMKANTPVPEGMDYFEIEATAVAKGLTEGKIEDFNSFDRINKGFPSGKPTFDAIEERTNYEEASSKWSATVCPVGFLKNPLPDINGKYYAGPFVPVKQ